MKLQAISLNQTRKTAIDPTVRTPIAIVTDKSKALPHDSTIAFQLFISRPPFFSAHGFIPNPTDVLASLRTESAKTFFCTLGISNNSSFFRQASGRDLLNLAS
jgi:hypothetical protein